MLILTGSHNVLLTLLYFADNILKGKRAEQTTNQDVFVQFDSPKSHWDHPLSPWQFLRSQAPGDCRVPWQDAGADEAGPKHGEGSHSAHHGGLWLHPELDEFPTDEFADVLEDATDIVRWINTDVMIADPLTKTMEPVKLVEMLDTNVLDITQPIEAVLKKRYVTPTFEWENRLPIVKIILRHQAQ